MKILKIFEEKLRYKNYSERSITLYVSYLSFFLKEEGIKDPYQITTKSQPTNLIQKSVHNFVY